MSNPVRVRFAPSPTGSLHVGGARTALYNYLLARQHHGSMVLRIEDTDQARSTHQAMQAQLQDLQWLGLTWDEGPEPSADYAMGFDGTIAFIGEHGPYRQSQRLEHYQRVASQLIDQGIAFYCFSQEPEVAPGEHPTPWLSPDRDLPNDVAQARLDAGQKAVVRFRLPDQVQSIVFEDLVRGQVVLSTDMIGDFVLLRADGMPVYNFCCVADDAAMGITHVLRGEEHLSNTLKQTLLYQALGHVPPIWGHLSIILGSDRKKLSKRQGAVSCDAFRRMGFVPQALLNYIALLGWSDAQGREILSMAELIDAFDVTRLQPSSAVFDQEKLRWVNEQHLKGQSDEALYAWIKDYCIDVYDQVWSIDDVWGMRFVALLRHRWQTLEDARVLLEHIQTPRGITDVDRDHLQTKEASLVLQAWSNYVAQASDCPAVQDTKAAIKQIGVELGVKGKALFVPLRLALLGVGEGVDVASVAALLTQAQMQERLQLCWQAVEG